jgi:putative membrane protein
MLWVKAFHIIFVVSWFAGLFYLPRIFVNHAMATEPAEIARLKLMEGKLYRFVTPIAWLAVGFGMWLWLGYGFSGGWLHAKLFLVLLLIGYHYYCGILVKQFAAGRNTQSCVLSLVQRNPGADSDGRGHPGHRKALLRNL